MKKAMSAPLIAAVLASIIASSCGNMVSDGRSVRCTCIYTNAEGAGIKVYDTIDKSDFSTAADQMAQCNFFGSSLPGAHKSCSL